VYFINVDVFFFAGSFYDLNPVGHIVLLYHSY
jgi:hypothetical protein